MIGMWFSFTLGALLIAGVTSAAIEENNARISLSSASFEGGVNAKFVSRGKKFWGIFVYPDLLKNPNALPVIEAEIGAITADNDMKWDALERAQRLSYAALYVNPASATRGAFNFARSDLLVSWAVSNGKMIRGYTLVWHSQLPSWVQNITNRVTLWDVVNEVLNEDGTLRRSVFSNVIGEAFITIAFQAARDTDSSAKLYLNDYNVLENNAKRQAMIALVNRINASSKLIDGLGAEVYANAGVIDEVQPALTELASTGLEVAITYAYIPGNAPNDWATLTKACLAVPSCVSLTIAPPENRWRPVSFTSLWDNNWKRTPAYDAVINVLDNST
ncbi:unnamed protein product [Cyclocybe aegerita]|uniref:Beta-xylanase n=1 Tax=Cyclocybe aegerita TaxID=1973307 RepID=A0A8S0W082_CYCAE|nr:unnamed protein product [Cyclocybe aegerita]